MLQYSDVDPGGLYSRFASDCYSGLNRELAVSVYSQLPNTSPFPNLDPPISIVRGPNNTPMLRPPKNTRSFELLESRSPGQGSARPLGPEINLQWSNISRFPRQKQRYYFQTPFEKYFELVNAFGPPDLINPQPGGMAVWHHPENGDDTRFRFLKRIEIIDEQCYNRFPYPHVGFLYTYYSITIPIDRLNHVLSLSGDLAYDPIKKILIIRGMSLHYNLALMALVHQYVRGKITWYQIIEQNLVHQILNQQRLTNPKNQNKIIKILTKK